MKSRFQTDCDRSVLLKAERLDDFDFLMVVFQNVGCFYRGHDGSEGRAPIELVVLPAAFVQGHYDALPAAFVQGHYDERWRGRLRLAALGDRLGPYADDAGIELVAEALGVPPITRGMGAGD